MLRVRAAGSALWLLLGVACAHTPVVGRPLAYGMCVPMGSSPPHREVVAADVLVRRSLAEHASGDLEGAYASSVAALEELHTSATPEDPTVVFVRRVLTANTVNLLLSLGREEAAATLLLAASMTDPVLGEELLHAAEALPHPMRCIAPAG